MKNYKVDYKVNGSEFSRVVEASNKKVAEEKLIKKLIEEGYTEGQTLRVTLVK